MAKTTKALPDYLGPLNVAAQPGDKLVPANDMSDVANEFASGRGAPDPLDLIPAKGK